MNDVSLVGRLGRNANTQILNEEKSITTFTMAVDTRGKTQWIPCKLWNVDALQQYLVKGKLISVSGEIIVDNYEKDGKYLTYTYVNVRHLELLSKKEDKGE